MSSKKKTSS